MELVASWISINGGFGTSSYHQSSIQSVDPDKQMGAQRRSSAESFEVDLDQYLRQPDASMHAALIVVTLLLAVAGRFIWHCISAWRWSRVVFDSSWWLLLVFVTTVAAVASAASTGLATHSIAIGISGACVIMPSFSRLSWRMTGTCFLAAVAFSCITTPMLLPDLIPWTPISRLPSIAMMTAPSSSISAPVTVPWDRASLLHVAPHDGSRVWLPETVGMHGVALDVFYRRTQISSGQWVVLSGGSRVMSIGADTTLRRVFAEVRNGSYVALFGSRARVVNCTLHCESIPCLLLNRRHLPSLHISDVVITHAASQSEFFIHSSADLCSIPAIGCIGGPIGVSTASDDHARAPSVFDSSWCEASAMSDTSLSLTLDARDCAAIAARVPWSIRMMERAPIVFGRVYTVLHFLHAVVYVQWLCPTTTWCRELWARFWNAVIGPLIVGARLHGWKIGTVLWCRVAPLLSPATLLPHATHSEYCQHVYTMHRRDDVFFEWTDRCVVSCLQLVTSMEAKVPILSDSLWFAWSLELQLAELLWRKLFDGMSFIAAGVAALLSGPLVRTLMLPIWRYSATLFCTARDLVWLSLDCALCLDHLSMKVAWAWNVNCLYAFTIAVQPLTVVLKTGWGVASAFIVIYGDTTFSTQVFVVIMQTGLLGLVLYRDFQNRVRQHRQAAAVAQSRRASMLSWMFPSSAESNLPAAICQSDATTDTNVSPTSALSVGPTVGPVLPSFLSSVSSVPLAVMAMLRHYSKPVAMYVVVHLVALLLAVGTMTIPFGSRLYAFCVLWVLPAASTHAWAQFFVDSAASEFWPYVMTRFVFRVVWCVLLQKTLGDFIFHVVYEILIGLVLIALCFLAVVWHGRRRRAATTHNLPSEENPSSDRGIQ